MRHKDEPAAAVKLTNCKNANVSDNHVEGRPLAEIEATENVTAKNNKVVRPTDASTNVSWWRVWVVPLSITVIGGLIVAALANYLGWV